MVSTWSLVGKHESTYGHTPQTTDGTLNSPVQEGQEANKLDGIMMKVCLNLNRCAKAQFAIWPNMKLWVYYRDTIAWPRS